MQAVKDSSRADETSDQHPLHVLLLEDNPGDAVLAARLLVETKEAPALTRVARLNDALAALERTHFDVALVDLSLPDATGLESVVKVHESAPCMPIIVLSGESDEAVALSALQRGACDYLVKGHLDGHWLGRAIRYGIERRRHEQRLEEMAYIDSLTGLPNRLVFLDRVDHALRLAQRDRSCVALMLLDLDRFKQVNDTLGHPAGDQLLSEVARRLEQTLRESDSIARFGANTAARLGGDEFGVLLEGVSDREAASRAADRVLEHLSEPVIVGDATLVATASVGVALYPDEALTAEDLIKCADEAMYRAKRSGGNNGTLRRAKLRA